jgi:hypothetical protein
MVLAMFHEVTHKGFYDRFMAIVSRGTHRIPAANRLLCLRLLRLLPSRLPGLLILPHLFSALDEMEKAIFTSEMILFFAFNGHCFFEARAVFFRTQM